MSARHGLARKREKDCQTGSLRSMHRTPLPPQYRTMFYPLLRTFRIMAVSNNRIHPAAEVLLPPLSDGLGLSNPLHSYSRIAGEVHAMAVSTNGAALVSDAEKSAILAQAEAVLASVDYDGEMDFHGVVSVKRTAFDLDTRTCRVPTIVTDKDGVKSPGHKVISRKSMYGVIFRKMNTVRGANLRDD